MWRIYYSGGLVVTGRTEDDWIAAPAQDVQVVVLYEPTEYRGWAGVEGDRQLWTGEDWFDPFGWGRKEGRLISDAEYFTIWEQAIADSAPTPE